MFGKKLLFLVLGLSIVAVGIFGALNLLEPSVKVEILPPHSPTNNVVRLDGKKLYPSGDGGKTYLAKSSMGKHTISLAGPFIESVTETVDLGSAETKNITISPKEVFPEQVLKRVIRDQEAKLHNIEVDGRVIAAVISSDKANENGDTSYYIFAGYEQDTGEWRRLDLSELRGKFNINQKTWERIDENTAE